MPRTYIRTKSKTYTPQDLALAIEKVKNGELTQYSAAQKYKIPMTTLYEHVKKHNHTLRPNAGRPTVIPLEQEKKLAEAITIMEKWGFGLSRLEIMDIVADYVRLNNIQTPFKNNIPGPDWFINFRKRHRLSIKKAQPVEFLRKKMTDPFVIASYFDLLENTLTDLNLFDKPHLIWNLDETSMCLDPSRTKVVGQTNKYCARTTYGSGKENITVLAGVSASGKKMPPLIVFKGKFMWDQWMAEQGDYDFELSYAASTKGWMETDIFYNYLEKIFIPNLGEERPVLVIYDGHSTHVDVRVVTLAIQNNVTILKLPPHTSHLLQPLDLAVFKSFKSLWDAKLVEWQRSNVGTKMPKKVFSQTLAETWQQTKPDIIKSGFKKAGIYPFNAHIIPVDKYDPDAYKRYQKHIDHTQPELENPKTLKQLCIDLFNRQLSTNDDSLQKSNNDNVTLLSQISKSNIQTLKFVAKQPTQLPTCLRNPNPIPNQTQNSTKIHIISNKILKKAPQPLLPTQQQPQISYSFEDLVLRKIQQDKKDTSPRKKKRVAKGAEVITATVGAKILEETDKAKKSKSIKKSKNYMKKPTTVNKKNYPKRKREPSSDSTITSVSDIISLHSDSDIYNDADFEQLMDSYEDDFETCEEQKPLKKYEKTENQNMLTNKDLNNPNFRTKNKGVGKKSKGKENQEDKKGAEKRFEKYDKQCGDDVIKIKEIDVTNREDFIKNVNDEQLLPDLESKGIIYETKERNPIKENYQLEDTVLVRYFIRQKWRYYIGFIEKIIAREETYYFINFLKSMKRQQQLTFFMPKRKDTDEVPESLIVKQIKVQKSDTDKEYCLCYDEDIIYFND